MHIAGEFIGSVQWNLSDKQKSFSAHEIERQTYTIQNKLYCFEISQTRKFKKWRILFASLAFHYLEFWKFKLKFW